MRIYYSPGQDPMVLDSLHGMDAVHARLRHFLASGECAVLIEAQCSGSSAPYDEFLCALAFEVSDGPISVSISPERRLKIHGSRENLATYASYFHFGEFEEGATHNPELSNRPGYMSPDSLWINIEVDTLHIREMEGES
jgi:hypothetical protein